MASEVDIAPAPASPRERRSARLSGTALVVGPLPPPYMGPALGTEMVCAALEAGGARAIHVNTQDRRAAESFVDQVGRFDLRNAWLALKHSGQLAVRAMRHRVDIVYIPIAQNRLGYARDALLMAIARVLGRDIVIHLRGSELQKFVAARPRPERWLVRRTLGWARMAIALTPSLRREFEGLVSADRVVVLENAIPDPWTNRIEDLRRERRERSVTDPSAMRLLFVSNLIADKGGLELIRALARPDLAEVRLRIMGAPSPADARIATDLIAEMGVAERVDLLGPCGGDRKLEQFRWADVLVHPTHRDGQPVVLIEAMAAALPLVGSQIGGVPETVGEAGVIVGAGDVGALADVLRALIDDPERRVALGDAARSRFESRYSVERYRERFAGVFATLLPADR